MEDKFFTLDEAAEVLPLGRTTVYEWAKKEKIRSQETEFGLRIILNDEEINKINMLKGKKNKNNRSESRQIIQNESEMILNSSEYTPNDSEYSAFIPNNSSMAGNDVMLAMLNQIRDLTSEVKELSKESGQVKLLTDNNKFYQDEYFKLKYENEQLTKRNKELEEKLSKKWWQLK